MAHHMKERYQQDVAPALTKEFTFENPMQVPRIEKVVVNIGVGEALDNAKSLDSAVADLTQITGQKPVVTKARRSIAAFKLREGRAIGVKVTLRGERMWSFLDRMINVALPRTRATFAACPGTASTGEATTPWVSGSRSSSRKSSTTRSTRCAASR